MSSTRAWVRQHRLTTFFLLTYLVSWAPWPLAEAGLVPEAYFFFPGGPLVAAVVVIALADGAAGYRELLARLLRWRVGWQWYVVAIALPALLVLATGWAVSWLGGAAPDLSGVVWADVAIVLAVRLVDPTDGAMGEEPGWRGYALPHLQLGTSPLGAATVLGVLAAGWHLPLVVTGNLSAVGLPTTVLITFLYVWLFNRTGGSLLMPLLFHASQGAFTYGMLGFDDADLRRAALVYLGFVAVAVAATVAFDRATWRTAPPSAVPAVPGPAALARR
ncbi:CPBP family intramembrane glutamic endopeptidase [Geodermatophilus sp. CPCC 206100]|uniref:CPBP family intramembrane glutamic endopeptidase n=1 Tax=Geodermatophilus sp. CPCC 206100 TaxID=3020054 RepID=UPI003AFFE79B